MQYYLIDYENVNAAGLTGIEEIPPESRVVLFFTKKANKIDLGLVNTLRQVEAELTIIEVHHGKQALDIQLGSYVGFLIGTEPEDTDYIIVSKDKGYRNIQEFWSDYNIYLCSSIRQGFRRGEEGEDEGELEEATAAEAAPEKEDKAPAEEPKTKGRKSSGKKRSSQKKSGDSDKGQSKGKGGRGKNQSQNRDDKPTDGDSRNEINTEIQKTLSKAGIEGDVINATASFVSRNIGKDGYKQLIYRGIIKENGQKKGLELYRLIKGML